MWEVGPVTGAGWHLSPTEWVSACDRHVGRVLDSFPRKRGALARGVVTEA